MKPAAVALAVSKVGAGGTARLLTELMLAQDKKCTSVISLIEYLYTALLSSHVLLRRRSGPDRDPTPAWVERWPSCSITPSLNVSNRKRTC